MAHQRLSKTPFFWYIGRVAAWKINGSDSNIYELKPCIWNILKYISTYLHIATQVNAMLWRYVMRTDYPEVGKRTTPWLLWGVLGTLKACSRIGHKPRGFPPRPATRCATTMVPSSLGMEIVFYGVLIRMFQDAKSRCKINYCFLCQPKPSLLTFSCTCLVYLAAFG